MIQSVIEQKVALAAYATEHGIAQLSAHQLDLANKVVAALLPVEEITKSISADAASVSVVLPYIRMLTKSLEKHHDDDGVQGMKREMLKSLRRRYGDAESNEFLVLSSILDPRFKDKCFSSGQVKTVARELLQQRFSALSTPVHAGEDIDSEEPAPKRPRTALLECFSEILQEAGASVSEDSENEIARYLSEPLIEFHRAINTSHGGQTTRIVSQAWPNLHRNICVAHLHLSPHRGYFHLLEMFMMRREIDWHQKEPRPFSSLRVTTMFLDTSADVDLSVYVHSFSYCIL